MFIYSPEVMPLTQEKIDTVKTEFGVIPAHWELLATINPARFEMFIDEIRYLQQHPHIKPDFFAFLRLFIATKEGFSYCKSFNTKLLLAKGYDKNVLKELKEDIANIPFDEAHRMLAQKVEKALYDPGDFRHDDIALLTRYGWNDADIYDAIDHGAFLFKFSRLIKAYSV